METAQEITDKPTKERSLPGGSNAHFHQQEVEGFAPPRLDAGDKTVWRTEQFYWPCAPESPDRTTPGDGSHKI